MEYTDLDENYLIEQTYDERNEAILGTALLNVSDAWVGTGLSVQYPDSAGYNDALNVESSVAILGAIALNPIGMVQLVFNETPESTEVTSSTAHFRFTNEIKACLEEFRMVPRYNSLIMFHEDANRGQTIQEHLDAAYEDLGLAFLDYLHDDKLAETMAASPEGLFDKAIKTLGYNMDRWFKMNVIEREIPKTMYSNALGTLVNLTIAFEGAVIASSTGQVEKEDGLEMLSSVSALAWKLTEDDDQLKEILYGDCI